MSVGSPVFFRDLNVGEVLGWDVGSMVKDVTIHAFVRAPFDAYVRDGSRFWNASGVSVKLGGGGVQVQMESIRALLLGGVAFDSTDEAQATPVSATDREFTLYADHDAALNSSYPSPDRRDRILPRLRRRAGGWVAGDVPRHAAR